MKLYTVLSQGFLRALEEFAISLCLYSFERRLEFCYALSVRVLTIWELTGCFEIREFLLSLLELFSDHLHRWRVLQDDWRL